MASKLGDEIGKKGPFASLEEEVMLSLLRTADRLIRTTENALRPSGLTPTQYNVLRILRGMAPQGLACQEIARRMITRDADLTRLLDRLEKRGLINRQRQTDDRRVVLITVTSAGSALLAELDDMVNELNKRLLGHLEAQKLNQLLDLMDQVRESIENMTAKGQMETL